MPAPPITTVVVDQYGDVVTVPASVTTGVVISGAGPQGPAGVDGSLAAAKIPDWAANTTIAANEVRRLPDGSLGRWIGPVGSTGTTFDSTKWTKLTGNVIQTVYVDDYVSQVIYATTYDAVQAALDAACALCATAPTTLEFNAKTYNINKGATYLTGGQFLQVSDNLANWLRITGRGKATIQHGIGTPAFIGPKGSTVGKTYGKIEIDGFFFDAANITSVAAVGIITHFNSTDYNIDGIHVHDCTGINAGALQSSSGRRWVCLNVSIPTAFSATQRIINDVKVERCDFTGGNTGILITAFCNATPTDNQWWGQTVPAANVLLDRIFIRDIKWDSGSTFYGTVGSAGCQVGADGFTKNVTIQDCVFKNGADVGVEIGGIENGFVSNVYCENFTNEGFFLSNNHGGLINPERQHVRFENCTAVASESRMTAPMAGFSAQSNHGSKFGWIEFVGCSYVHTAPTFLQTSNGLAQGSPSAPFLFNGSWRDLSVRECSVLYDGLAFVFTSATKTLSPAVIDVSQSGDTSKLEVKNLTCGWVGSLDSGANTGTALQTDFLKVKGSRMHLDVDGLHYWSNLTKIGSPAPSVRFRDLNITNATTTTDSFTNSSLTKDYVIEAGAITDLSAATGPVTSVANPTVRKLFKITSMKTASVSLMDSVNRVLDFSEYIEATVPTTTPQGFELIIRGRISTDGLSAWRAILDDDGTNSRIRIEKVEGGAVTAIVAGPTNLAARMTTGGTVGLRFSQKGDLLTADYFIGTAGRTFGTVGSTRVTYAATASDARIFRGSGAAGYVGFGWTPGDNTSTLVQFRHEPMAVFSGRVRGLSPLSHQQDVSTSNAIIGGDSTRLRIENPPLLLSWDRTAVALHGDTEISGPDSTFKSQMLVEQGSTWGSPPTPALITVSASPFVYINQDGYIQDVAIYGGTLTTPFIELSKDSGVTFSQIAGTNTEKIVRLAPGDQLRVTYSAAPTMRKIPIL